jgi:GMP synthase-like glutamine amidotransferase
VNRGDDRRPALVLQHGDLGPPGLLGEWLEERGIPMRVHRIDHSPDFPEPREHSLVACLGSRFGPVDPDPSVARSRRCLERALADDVPVLGLCFGGQVLADILGAEGGRTDPPVLGWREIDTDDPASVPPGPWLQWHWERFGTPPGAEEVARSPTGTEAFRYGPHLGVQFHPESTIDIVAGWAEFDRDRIAEFGVENGRALLEAGRAHAAAAADNARKLFDAFWERARNDGRES